MATISSMRASNSASMRCSAAREHLGGGLEDAPAVALGVGAQRPLGVVGGGLRRHFTHRSAKWRDLLHFVLGCAN